MSSTSAAAATPTASGSTKKKPGRKPKTESATASGTGQNGRQHADSALLSIETKFSPTMDVRRKEHRTWTYEETSRKYPDIKHTWFCNGRLLMLFDGANLDKIRIFQDVWSYNMVSKN